MELVLVNGEACVKKEVTNENIYRTLAANKIAGIPEIIKVDNGVVYYKYVNGETLKSRIANKQEVSKEFVRFLGFSCTKTLAALKDLCIVHNDITPENIIISPKEQIYLIDFESATFESGEVTESEVNISEYSSPELKNGMKTTFASDIYSLGVVLKEVDFNEYFTNVTTKCCGESVGDRYSAYTALSYEINTTYSNIQGEEDKVDFSNYFTKKMLVTIACTLILGLVVGLYFSQVVDTTNTMLYLVFSIYGAVLILDLIDYARVIILKGRKYRKVLPFKFVVSCLMFFLTTVIALMLM